MGTEIGKAKSKRRKREGVRRRRGERGSKEGRWLEKVRTFASVLRIAEREGGRAKVITTAPPLSLSLSLSPSSLLRKRQKMVQQLERQRAGEGGFNMVV